MNLSKKIVLLILYCSLISCATYSPPSLPANLKIIPPSPEVPHDVAAFSGIWEGSWAGMANTDSIITVEKIDAKKADLIFSMGGKKSAYLNFCGEILPGPKIRWEMAEAPPFEKGEKEIKCPCIMTFELLDDFTMIGYWEFKAYNFKLRGDFSKRKD